MTIYGTCLAAVHSQVRELIYRELLEYHPHMLADYLSGNRQQPSFMYPSAVDNFKRQFAHLEGGGAYGGAAAGKAHQPSVVACFCGLLVYSTLAFLPCSLVMDT